MKKKGKNSLNFEKNNLNSEKSDIISVILGYDAYREFQQNING